MTREEIQQEAEKRYYFFNSATATNASNINMLQENKRLAFISGAIWMQKQLESENAALKQQVRELELSNLDKVNAELQVLTTKAENTALKQQIADMGEVIREFTENPEKCP